jgi:hypothetical protein
MNEHDPMGSPEGRDKNVDSDIGKSIGVDDPVDKMSAQSLAKASEKLEQHLDDTMKRLKERNEPIRRLIRRTLIRLVEDISELQEERKTIGVLSNGDIGNVLVSLHKMYLSPDGYNMTYLNAHTDKMKEVHDE